MTKADERDISGLPVNLRALLTAELAAGNEIVEVGHTFPAPPAGAYVKLAKPLQTRDGGLPTGVHYYDRKGSSYSGEITDAKRFYFLLEPPHPPEPEPDMDAIRAAVNAASGFTQPVAITPPETAEPARASFEHTTLIEKFERSMVIDYEKWHDGIGYDLDVLRQMSEAEKKLIESLLIRRGLRDWRDVEALAEINSPTAHTALKAAINHSSVEIRNAVTRHAPELIAPATVAEPRAAAQFQLTIWVDDCNAACAELHARGVELINGPIDRAWGQRTACFADPDGHIWELAQTLG